MHNQNYQRCDGVRRRDVLRIGSLTGLGLSLVDLLRARAIATEPRRVRAKSCILLWLDGGPSHLESFDLKPSAPAEVRGPFQPINTNVAGVQISELLPETAKVTDKLAIIRSMTSPLGEHGIANQYMLTGYKPTPVLQYPSYGSVVSNLRPGQPVLPPYIAIPESRSAGSGFLGRQFEPFVVGGDPSKPDFKVQDLDFFPGVDEARLRRRRDYLNEFDAAQANFESRDLPTDSSFDRAYRLITSSESKGAFDLVAGT